MGRGAQQTLEGFDSGLRNRAFQAKLAGAAKNVTSAAAGWFEIFWSCGRRLRFTREAGPSWKGKREGDVADVGR